MKEFRVLETSKEQMKKYVGQIKALGKRIEAANQNAEIRIVEFIYSVKAELVIAGERVTGVELCELNTPSANESTLLSFATNVSYYIK